MSWRLPILVALPYLTRAMVAVLRTLPRSAYRLMIDSGAFTAWMQNKTIPLASYLKMLDAAAVFAPDHIVQLDVIGDPDATWANYLEIVKAGYTPAAGFNVMPVVTSGAPAEHVARAYEHADYVLAGGITNGPDQDAVIKWFATRTPPGKKAHWLGYTRIPMLARYRPTSVDSSSWMGGHLFGNFAVYTGNLQSRRFTREHALKGERWLRDRLGALGLPPGTYIHLREPGAWTGHTYRPGKNPARSLASFVGVLSAVVRARDVERRYTTRQYLAVANANDARLLVRAYQHLQRTELLAAA